MQKKPKRRNFKDSLILGPIDKYVRYGLFPWKFLVHVTLLFLTASQVLMLIKPESAYQSQISYLINDLFMTTDGGIGSYSPDLGNGNNPSAAPIIVYNIPDLVQFINRTRNNYFFSLEKDDMLSKMYPGKNETTGAIMPIKMYTFTSKN